MMVHVHVPSPSKRAQDLEHELRATIAGFQSREPKTNADDVRMALAAVTPGTPATPARRIATIVTVVGLTVVFGLIGLLMGAPAPRACRPDALQSATSPARSAPW